MQLIWAFLTSNLGQVFAGVIVMIYAWQRYGTPRKNKCSTTRAQFYSTCCFYVLCALAIYVVLSEILKEPEALAFLTFGANFPSQDSKISADLSRLSAPYLSALFLTTLLPSIPFLRDFDGTLLRFFQRLGSIPLEVNQLKNELRSKIYSPSIAIQNESREFLKKNQIPKIVAEKLKFDFDGSARCKFARTLALYCEILRLDTLSPFLSEFSQEDNELRNLMKVTCAQAAGYFTFADAIPNVEPNEPATVTTLRGATSSLLKDAESAFDEGCDSAHEKICLLLAQGLLNASWSGNRLRHHLKSRGFSTIVVPEPVLLNTVIAAGLLILGVFIAGIFLFRALGWNNLRIAQQVILSFIVAINYALAAAFAIIPKQVASTGKCTPDRGRPMLAYLFSALFTALAASAMVILNSLWSQPNPTSGISGWTEGGLTGGIKWYLSVTYPWIFPPIVASLILAILSDNYVLETSEPKWLRWVEGLILGALLVFTTFGAASWFRDLREAAVGSSGASAYVARPHYVGLILVAISFANGMILGSLVPRAYRKARRMEEKHRSDYEGLTNQMKPHAIVDALIMGTADAGFGRQRA